MLSPKTKQKLRWSAWGAQFWALLGSVVAFASMVILLGIFNGKTVFTWHSVTLNTMVSILSLAMKASLVFVLAECMAQWKWILFADQARPLMDFDRIDWATRGPLGCVRVLWKTRRALCLQFGAALTLLALGLDPFAQQLVQLRNDLVWTDGPDDFISLSSQSNDGGPQAINFAASGYSRGKAITTEYTFTNSTWDGNKTNSTEYRTSWETTEIDPSMESSMLFGLSRSPSEADQRAVALCPTGNCTWNSFETLGVCHRCNNITSQLKRGTGFDEILNTVSGIVQEGPFPATGFYLPNGHFIANVDDCPPYNGWTADCKTDHENATIESMSDSRLAITSFGTGNPNKTNSMKDIDTLIWSTSVIHPNMDWLNTTSLFDVEWSSEGSKLLNPKYWPDIPMQATECAIYYCVKTVNASVEGNKLLEKVVEAKTARRDPQSWEYITHNDDEDIFPENIPPADERDSLEFHRNYSVIERSALNLKFPEDDARRKNLNYEVAPASVKSISAYVQSILLGKLPNTEEDRMSKLVKKKLGKNAVGFNGAAIGPGTAGDSESLDMDSYPPRLTSIWSFTKFNMSSTFYALATSMTNEIRTSTFNLGEGPSYGQDESGDVDWAGIQGRVGTMTVVYDIRWPWIALHAAMMLAGACFFLVTLWNSWTSDTVPLWKGSSLATIRHGYQMGDLFEGIDSVEEMEDKARKVRVQVPRGEFDESSYMRTGDSSTLGGSERVSGQFESGRRDMLRPHD